MVHHSLGSWDRHDGDTTIDWVVCVCVAKVMFVHQAGDRWQPLYKYTVNYLCLRKVGHDSRSGMASEVQSVASSDMLLLLLKYKYTYSKSYLLAPRLQYYKAAVPEQGHDGWLAVVSPNMIMMMMTFKWPAHYLSIYTNYTVCAINSVAFSVIVCDVGRQRHRGPVVVCPLLIHLILISHQALDWLLVPID